MLSRFMQSLRQSLARAHPAAEMGEGRMAMRPSSAASSCQAVHPVHSYEGISDAQFIARFQGLIAQIQGMGF